MLSRWETGDRTPKPEQVAQILATLGINGDRYKQIMTLAYGTKQNATRIIEVMPLLIPGLLQTDDYIRAVMTAPGVPEDEIESRIETRISRREVLTKHNPAKLLVLLGQGALNQGIAGRQVMIEQLRHLVRMSARPNIELRLIPDNRGFHPGLDDAFTYIESPQPDALRDSKNANGPALRGNVVALVRAAQAGRFDR